MKIIKILLIISLIWPFLDANIANADDEEDYKNTRVMFIKSTMMIMMMTRKMMIMIIIKKRMNMNIMTK